MGSVSVNQQVQEDNVAKSKLEWTPELHSNFMRVVINLGGTEKAKPKKILNAMNVPGLTRLHVSSHLQKVRGFMKSGGHKRTNRLARNHQHFIQRQLADPPPASSHHATSYNRGCENLKGGADYFVPDNSDLLAAVGDLSFTFETEGIAGENEYSSYPYQENYFFAGLGPTWNHFGFSTAGQENYPMMPPFSAYATNQETDVMTQFVPPTPLPCPTQLDGQYDCGFCV